MNLLHPSAQAPAPRAQAASLKKALAWYGRQVWQVMETMGQRRAAPELRRLAHRMAREGNPAAPEVLATAETWSRL